jgi:hypothetical protein
MTEPVKKTFGNLPGPGPGRPKGVPNKTTALLKDALLQAATEAGDGSMVAYLVRQAKENPGPFMGLLGKVIPLQVGGDPDNPLKMITVVELVAPDGNGKD